MAGRILFDSVWKRFHRGPAHDSLRDLIPAMARRLTGRAVVKNDLGDGDFWAVRDVSFEVKPGEALGIIGGNGAGKSTTLKLLTKILRPTRGTALVEGRVGSLIEVSAGFHQDLTGRENVFLQGAIMGMPQQLIRDRFEEIVEFSGVSAFIDTPVKRYSSGMNARLGFSIAVHLEPDALIIDEVLSVGDADFQSRAFERIRALVRGNIPVVIVSHQLDRIVELCTNCVLLVDGSPNFIGAPALAVRAYLDVAPTAPAVSEEDGTVSHAFLALNPLGPTTVRSGERFEWEIMFRKLTSDPDPTTEFAITVSDSVSNRRVSIVSLRMLNIHPVAAGTYSATVSLQANLAEGLYRLETLVLDSATLIGIGRGPMSFFQVESGLTFSGSHQLNIEARPR